MTTMNPTVRARSLRRQLAFVGSAVVLLVTMTGAAQARDYCVDAEDYHYVAKGMRVPKNGTCKPIAGWRYNTMTSSRYPFSGTACTAFDGDHVDLMTVTSGRFDTLSLSLTGGPGSYAFQFSTGQFVGGSPAAGALCTGESY